MTTINQDSANALLAIDDGLRLQSADLDTLLLKQGRAVREATYAVDFHPTEAAQRLKELERTLELSKATFQGLKAKRDKINSQRNALKEMLTPAEVNPHQDIVEAWTSQATEAARYKIVPIDETGCATVHLDDRQIGSIVSINTSHSAHYGGPTTWQFMFAPLRCIEQVALGPFDNYVEVLDAAASVTPFDPDVHGFAAIGNEIASRAGAYAITDNRLDVEAEGDRLRAEHEVRVQAANARDASMAPPEGYAEWLAEKVAAGGRWAGHPTTTQAYDEWLDAKVRASLEDLNQGKGIPGDVVEAHFAARRAGDQVTEANVAYAKARVEAISNDGL